MAIFKKVKPEFEKIPLKGLFIASFLVSAFGILIGIIAQFFLPPQIPLYFGLPQTNAQLAKPLFIILPSFLSLFISMINTIISIRVSDAYLKKTLAFASLAVCILAIVTTLKIIFLVSTI